MSRLIDLTGQRFGRLNVIRRDTEQTTKCGIKWICVCDCGNVKSILGDNLKKGKTQSCGCLQSELTSARCRIYGEGSECRLYRIWKAMKSRCYYAKDIGYPLYGGRGIKVCADWKGSYPCFKEWATKNGYSDLLTLDRANPNGDYEPSNCRWVDCKTQSNNTRRNVRLTHKGETHTVAEWGRITGIRPCTIARRKRDGWTDADCLEVPAVRGNNQQTRKNDFHRKD